MGWEVALTTKLSSPLRFGIIGAGVIARNAHARPFIEHADQVRLVAVCDGVEGNARAMADEVGGEIAVLTEHRELLARRDIDAVIVATPHFSHFDLARDSIAAGKPVLVEKPVACTLAEMRELQACSEKTGVQVIAGQMRRFEPDIVWLRDWVAATPANFGELRSFDIQSWQNLEGYLHQGGAGLKHWLLDGKRAGGGVVISLAIHQLDLIRYLFDADYVEVRANARFDSPFYNDAESSAAAMLTLSNGATGLLHANYLAPRVPFCEALSAFGSNGTIIQHVEQQGDYRGPFKYASTGGVATTSWPAQWEGFRTVPPHPALDPNSFVNQTLAFADVVRNGTGSPNSLGKNFNTIAVIEAIARSIRTGETVTVEKN